MSATNPDAERKSVGFDQVLLGEYQAITERRQALGISVIPSFGESRSIPREIFGVALSGGGVRSACFCLGALQALDRYKLIPRIDYLSTVSGGGYIGASMVSALTRSNGEFPFAVAEQENGDVRDNEPVSHIRDHSRYLAPKGLSDLLLTVAVVLRGLAVNLLLVLSVLFPLATLTILANPSGFHLRHNILYDLARYFEPPAGWKAEPLTSGYDYLRDPFLLTKATGVLLVLFLIVWGLRRSYLERHSIQRPQRISEPRSRWTRAAALLLVLFLLVVIIEVQSRVLARIIDWYTQAGPSGTSIVSFGGVLMTIIASTALFHERLVSLIQKALSNPTIGARIQAWSAKLALYAAALALPALIYLLFLTLCVWGIATAAGTYPLAPSALADPGIGLARYVGLALLISFAIWLVLLLTRPTGREIFSSMRATLFEHGWRSLAAIVLTLMFVSALTATAIATRAPGTSWFMLYNYLAISAFITFLAMNFAENANALHRLYRDRLNIAFRLGKGRLGIASLPLGELGTKSPYLLVNGTLNVRRSTPRKRRGSTSPEPATDSDGGTGANTLPSTDPAKRGRNAEFFLFSKGFVGSDATGYASTEAMTANEPQLDLATAAAISGAAVSSSMGRVGARILSPTLALLNLRLGYWLRNPRYVDDAQGPAPQDAAQPAARVKASWYDFFRFYLAAEAFGILRSDSSRIFVSDGGHIDNSGLYQLLKRKCQMIMVIDAEADPAMNFGALVDVQRFARIDLGIRIAIDWEAMRNAMLKRSADRAKRIPPDDEAHCQHFAVGKIIYDQAGTEGILVYVKASVTGDEPDYVLDYERRYPLFPHESTGDQFFSEEQMEAYRSLGFHAANCALKEQKSKAIGPIPQATVISEFKRRLGIAGQTIS
ncbi:patatin-like phospholipase family protein [Phyllobacterium lublinensis]|uniref:patatin-like phospholipase family protein n=1 Tax=Phyllobacterium lublinensis TaxID=2875708 RepID=UPI001CCBCD8C|nr:patatin-like phospholipase family protein [Phyllobacterium sp. 2063]MBZ9655301.1 patatin-like phospholipase family protein [Phyllobacterium sp. 2063]